MTTATRAAEVEKRLHRARPKTLAGDLLIDILALRARLLASQQSFTQYQTDIVGFARDVLGYVPCETIEECESEVARQRAANALAGKPDEQPRILWRKQIQILKAAQNHRRVAVRSGRKVSKSFTAAIIALWFYCCFSEARVVMTAVTARQVDEIIWREVRRLIRKSTRAIPGADTCGELARTGLKSAEFQQLTGHTAREAEAIAGISGKNLLYLADEASGIDRDIFEAIDGNLAGGARLVMFSNPTKTSGVFFEAFDGKKDIAQISVSSCETPNAETGREIIQGLAGRDWIEEKQREWGVDSPQYKVHVLGDFVFNEEGRVISLDVLRAAEERWEDAREDGRLHIGVDPAGPGAGGDNTVFAVRRGVKLLQLYSFNGLTEDGHLAHLLGIIKEHRKPREIPVVVIDRDGPIGWKVAGAFAGHSATTHSFDLAQIRPSDKALRAPDQYDRIRDELWACLAVWLRTGAIPEDARLAKELHSPSWIQIVTGKLKATSKDDLRRELDGRSPDRADALALAVWDPVAYREDTAALPSPAARAVVQHRELEAQPGFIDPYGGGV